MFLFSGKKEGFVKAWLTIAGWGPIKVKGGRRLFAFIHSFFEHFIKSTFPDKS